MEQATGRLCIQKIRKEISARMNTLDKFKNKDF